MSNTRIQAATEVLSAPDREISPLERMQSMASAWMNATPQARAHALAASQASSMEEADPMIETRAPQPISHRANDLLAAYVAIEREQHRLAEAGFEKEADALGEPALEAQRKIFALRDRTGNPDLIAARVMADLMICHNWRELEAGESIVWSHEEREIALPLLEAVADQTTGTVREHVTKALATIGVDVRSEAPDPLRKLVQEFRDGLAAINAVPHDDDDAADALDREKLSPLFGILTTTPPAPTTTAGAAEAIRLVRDQNSGGSYCPDMIRCVLTVVADALDGKPLLTASTFITDRVQNQVTALRENCPEMVPIDCDGSFTQIAHATDLGTDTAITVSVREYIVGMELLGFRFYVSEEGGLWTMEPDHHLPQAWRLRSLDLMRGFGRRTGEAVDFLNARERMQLS